MLEEKELLLRGKAVETRCSHIFVLALCLEEGPQWLQIGRAEEDLEQWDRMKTGEDASIARHTDHVGRSLARRLSWTWTIKLETG